MFISDYASIETAAIVVDDEGASVKWNFNNSYLNETKNDDEKREQIEVTK